MVYSRHPFRLEPGTPEQWAEVRKWRGMVCHFARLYYFKASSVLEYGDLVAAGWLGALEAVQQRDPDMNFYQWKRFVGIKVRRRIQYHLEEQAAPIRVPDKPARDYIRRVRPGSRALAAADRILEQLPTPYVDEVADPRPIRADPLEVADVRAALLTLPAPEREAIEACFGIGRDWRPAVEVAAQLGVTPSVLSGRKKRGLAKLRHKFQLER